MNDKKSSNPKGPIFLDDENELSSEPPTFYQALGVRERLNKTREERGKGEDNDKKVDHNL